MDGKILEFRASLLVEDVLAKLSGSGVGLSKAVTQHLPLNYELKLGKVYYILPGLAPSPSPESIPTVTTNSLQAGDVKTIKVVITKQELQQLWSRQKSLEEVLAGLEKINGETFESSPWNWKPKLESISEEKE